MICTHWQRMTHFNLTFPDTRQTPPCYSSPRGSGPFELKNFNSPSSPLSLCPFFPVLPFLLVYVMHQLCDSFGSLFLLSFILSFFLSFFLSFCVVLSTLYHLSLFSNSSLLCFWHCFYTFSFQLASLYSPDVDVFPQSHPPLVVFFLLYPICISLF